MINDSDIVNGVHKWASWWVDQRRKKLIRELSNTMSINPFLTPFLFDYHNLNSIDDFVDLVLASHLMNGHNTGFGKLVDEKILPHVFGAIKLDAAYRRANIPLANSPFDEIDHIIERQDGNKELLSLKAGKWTIQLTMAIQLNRSFQQILQYYSEFFDKIVVGVYYGNREDLTDKYEILRGINRGAEHHVANVTENVRVLAGKEFWSWLSGGNPRTQDLVLMGIISAIESKNIKEENKTLMKKFKNSIGKKFDETLGLQGNDKWLALLNCNSHDKI